MTVVLDATAADFPPDSADATVSPRPEVASLPRVVHGAVKDVELATLARAGIAPGQVLDFSVNSNPLGPPPEVLRALAGLSESDVARYPDDGAARLVEALAAFLGVSGDRLLVGNGSAELLWLVCLAYLRPGDAVAVFGPTFGEYARAAGIAGARVVTLAASAGDGFALDLDRAIQWLRAVRPRLAFVCNPNNPTGTALDTSAVVRLAHASPGTLLVVDEAYAAFLMPGDAASALRASVPLVDECPVLLVRSMTKDYAIAGLRLGYAVGTPAVVDALARVKPPWSVSRPAQVAGIAALGATSHLERARLVIEEALPLMSRALRAAGHRPLPTRTNYFLAEVGNGEALRASLMAHGIVVRDCASFGLPMMVRLAARPTDECGRLASALRAVGGSASARGGRM